MQYYKLCFWNKINLLALSYQVMDAKIFQREKIKLITINRKENFNTE